MARSNFENLVVYQHAERLSDEIWAIVGGWDYFSKDTVGKQLVRSADSIGANIAEGAGRGSFQDDRRFVRTARGSLNENRQWLRRAHQRNLIPAERTECIRPLIDELSPKLNAYLRSIGPVSLETETNGE